MWISHFDLEAYTGIFREVSIVLWVGKEGTGRQHKYTIQYFGVSSAEIY